MTDPKRSLRVPASRRARLPSPPQRFSPHDLPSSLPRNFWSFPSVSLAWCSALGDRSLFLPLQLPPPASDLLSPLRRQCLSVPSKSLALHKLSDPPTESQTTGPQIRRRSPSPSRRPAPSQSRRAPGPSWLRPASPARSHLVSLARAAAAAAAIYARPGWSWSFKPRFPGARRGAARSLLAPAAANHTPLSPRPRPTPLELLRSSRPKAARVKPL